jgi:hypothetical protein
MGLLEEIKSPTKTEEIQSDGVGVGGSFKECVSDKTEHPSMKRKILEHKSDSAKLLDVTCQREGHNKCEYGAKLLKRVLDCDDDDDAFSCKYQKLEACNVGLNTFTNSNQLNTQNEEFQAQEEVDCDCEGQYLGSTDSHEDLHHSDADVVQAQSAVFSGSEEVCQDKDNEGDIDCDSNGLQPTIAEFHTKHFESNAMAEAQSQVHSGTEHVEEGTQRQKIGVNVELVYELDRKRLEEALSDELMERRKLKVQGNIVDLMDEASLEHVPSSHLYERLQAVDPDMAQQLHPNNKRKIIR